MLQSSMPTDGYRTSAAIPSWSWASSRACGSQPPRWSFSNFAPSGVSSSGALPAAETSESGMRWALPSMRNTSPRFSSCTMTGARSRYFGSMRST